MPAWLLCRRERPARRDDGHDGEPVLDLLEFTDFVMSETDVQ